MTVIPTIDLQPFATGASPSSVEAVRVAAEIDAALHEVGFLLVTGHGIDQGVKDALFERMRAFFSLPLDAKEALAIGKSDCHRGYVGTAAEALDGVLGTGEDPIDTPPAGDLKETLDTGTEHGADHPEVLAGTPLDGANQLPHLPGFREAWAAYLKQATEAALRMQRGLALALGLAPGFFEHQPGETMLHLRLVHYPPVDRVRPEPGQLGCGAHTDYGTLTVLADDGVGGLQVRERLGA